MTEALPSEWIDKVRAAERSGDHITAYDVATQGLAEHPDDVQLRYRAALALARSGATAQAAALYKRYELDREQDPDIEALGARIAKDAALAAAPRGRRAALRAAAKAYGWVYARTRRYYPAINAATLYLLAGDAEQARAYARRTVNALDRTPDTTALDRYYRWATHAEAALIRRDVAGTQAALREAARHLAGDFDAAATTRKQLRLVCGATGTSSDILDLIRPPSVLHYGAPMLATAALRSTFDRRGERAAIAAISAHLVQHRVGYAYGSLSAGAEILCAEACIGAGVELHIVLPFNEKEFVDTMVRVAGPVWVRRFRACLRGAKSVTLATPDSYQGDDALFTYAGRLAMGMAILRAQHLDAAASHLWLQSPGWNPDPAGHATSLKMWHAQARPSHTLALTEHSAKSPPPKKPPRVHRLPPRHTRALLFGDVKGFSKTPDYLIPVFQKRVMGAIAAGLRRYDRHVLYRASWGDAIYVVMDDPIVAAECCLAVQDAIAKARPARFGLSPDMALRLAAHFGPVYDGHDPIRDEPTFFGAPTTMTARMEPVTAPGHVYVTEAMAAAIAMAGARLRAEYVGSVPMAKGFGSTRMYSLKRV